MQAQIQAAEISGYYVKSIWSVAICAAILGSAGGGGGADGEYHEPTLHAPGDSVPQNSAGEQQQQQHQYQQQTVLKAVGGYQSAL